MIFTDMISGLRVGTCLAAVILLLMVCLAGPAPAIAESEHEESTESKISYGKQGLQFDDGTGNNFLWFGVRLQTRWRSNSVLICIQS